MRGCIINYFPPQVRERHVQAGGVPRGRGGEPRGGPVRLEHERVAVPLGRRQLRHEGPPPERFERASEKDTKLAQKLGQLQQFTAVLPPECMGQLASFGPTEHRSRCSAGRRRRGARSTPGHSAAVGIREQRIGGFRGAHLNPLGLFLRTSVPCIWHFLSAFRPA